MKVLTPIEQFLSRRLGTHRTPRRFTLSPALVRTVGGVAIIAALAAGLCMFLFSRWSELIIYETAATRMLQGEAIYRPNERAFTYPPLFAVPFLPLVMLPEAVRRPLWYLVNVVVLVIIFWRLNHRLQPGLRCWPGSAAERRPVPLGLFWFLVVVLAGRHVLAPLENQSHDLIIFLTALLAIDGLCAARSKSGGVLAGFWAALGTALKATPLLFAPLLLWQRRFAAVLVFGVALVGLSLLPDLLCPARDGTSWTVSWYHTFISTIKPGETATSAAWAPWNQLNQSVAGTLYRLLTPFPNINDPDFSNVSVLALDTATLRYVTLAAQLAVGLWLCWVTRPGLTHGLPAEEQSFLRLGEGAVLVTAMVLLSPTSIKTHFCVLLLPVAFCLADFLYRRRDWLVGALLGLALVLGTATVKGLLGRTAGNWIMASGSVTWTALALYLAAGRVLLQRSRAVRGREAVT